jgi:hypothetical protein
MREIRHPLAPQQRMKRTSHNPFHWQASTLYLSRALRIDTLNSCASIFERTVSKTSKRMSRSSSINSSGGVLSKNTMKNHAINWWFLIMMVVWAIAEKFRRSKRHLKGNWYNSISEWVRLILWCLIANLRSLGKSQLLKCLQLLAIRRVACAIVRFLKL